MKKIFSAIGYCLLVAVLSLGFLEFSYRAAWRFGRNDLLGYYALKTFRLRLWRAWLGPPGDFLPPFQVFANKNFQDIERLRRILAASKLPPSGTWHPVDFLLEPLLIEDSTYEVRSNSLGFRDPERSLKKAPGTFRILALGSYMTFGHAVPNQDTYSSQLEALLNKESTERRFEVWNGGRHTGTAIQGWARLALEGDAIKPDLILWEYWFVDPHVRDDDLFLPALRMPYTGPWGVVRRAAAALLDPYLINSAVFFKLHRRDLGRPPEGSAHREVNQLAVAWARKRGIPIILISQHPTATGQAGVHFYQTRQAFTDFPPTPKHIREFHRSSNWTDEFAFVPGVLKFGHVPNEYFADFYQYNRAGHRAVAQGLKIQILKLVPRG